MTPPFELYFARAFRAGPGEASVRTPELRSLGAKTIAQFGVGCLGAASALEFVRAGIGELRILDRDHVDPGTIGRWPFGLSVAGLPKVKVLAQFIGDNYPMTRVVPVQHWIGSVRHGSDGERPDAEVIAEMTESASIIYDATVEIGVQHYLSGVARRLRIPYVAVAATYGGWGGKVVCIDPDRTEGCWMCYRYACADGTIPEPPSDPDGEVQPLGCGDVTFTGAGFDMAQVALMGVRTTVAVLCRDARGGYPEAPWDVLTMAFRDEGGELIVPSFQGHRVRRHPQCPRCNAQ